MGLFGDWVRAEIYGNQVRETIKELKKQVQKGNEDKICGNCGRIITKGGGVCKESKAHLALEFGSELGITQELLCNKCIKECKRCGKIFCPKHKSTHNC